MGIAKYDRLLFILNLLRTRRNLTAGKLAEECGVTERSIYRDIISLSEANVPIYYDNGYKLATDYFLPPLNFSFEEYSFLKLALDSNPLTNTQKYSRLAKSIKAKIETGLSEVVKEKRRGISGTTHLDITVKVEQQQAEKFYGRIEDAVTQNFCLELTYDSIHSGLMQRMVEPYFIVFKGRAFYFVAFCRLRGDFRTFRLDRVKGVKLLEEHFQRKPDITAERYFEGAWQVYSGELHTVVAIFSGMAARVVSSTRHHPTERIEVQTDGSVRYQVEIRGLEEIKRWLLGFGGEVRVEEPEALRQSLVASAEALLRTYHLSGSI